MSTFWTTAPIQPIRIQIVLSTLPGTTRPTRTTPTCSISGPTRRSRARMICPNIGEGRLRVRRRHTRCNRSPPINTETRHIRRTFTAILPADQRDPGVITADNSISRLGRRNDLVRRSQHHLSRYTGFSRGSSAATHNPTCTTSSSPENQNFVINDVAGGQGFYELLRAPIRRRDLSAFAQGSFNLPAGFQIQLGGRYSATTTENKVGIDQYVRQLPDFQSASANNFSYKAAAELERQRRQLALRISCDRLQAGRPERSRRHRHPGSVPAGNRDGLRSGLEVDLLRRPCAHADRRLL